MTPDMIKGIAIGVCIGFIIPIVIYLFLKRMEYKPRNPENYGIPEMKNISYKVDPFAKIETQNPESESHVN